MIIFSPANPPSPAPFPSLERIKAGAFLTPSPDNWKQTCVLALAFPAFVLRGLSLFSLFLSFFFSIHHLH